jgi:hypothetical protein
MLAVAGLTIMASCSNDEGAFVLRSDDHVDLDYTATAGTFTVCTDGAWSVSTDADWFTISPSSGTGDGTTRDVVTITPKQNTSSARTDSVYLMAGGRKLGIGINQAEGFVELGTPLFSGNLYKKTVAKDCYISVPYSKAVEGETYTATVTMAGSSEGLTVSDVTYTAASSGTIKIPVTGTPTTAGNLDFTISTGLPNADNVKLSVIVAATPKITIFAFDFSKFIYGGDASKLADGINPKIGSSLALTNDEDGTGKTYDPAATISSCGRGDDGSGDVFSTMSNSYRTSRGIQNWVGNKVYERPGYVKIGTGSAAGYITTPAFSTLVDNGGEQDVIVTLTMMAWYQNTGATTPIKFTVTGGGTPSIASAELTQRDGGTLVVPWTTVVFTIKDATPSTKLRIEPQSSTKTYFRFMLSDITVTTTGL